MRTKLLLLLLLLPVAASGQVTPVDLYSGEVAVASQDSGERARALPKALEHVLQKLSGLRYFDDYPLVEPALENAAGILISFHYRNLETTLADGSAGSELRLVANFSETKVNELARSLELPLWKPDRAPVEIWVVVDDGRGRRTFPVEYSYAWSTLGDTAVDRGIAVTQPAPDEDGQYPIDAQLLWGGYTEDLSSEHRGGVMIAAARREGLEWSVRNNLSYEGGDWTWREQNIDLQAALTESLQKAIDRVAAANTIAASDLGTWSQDLTITGLNNAADYRRCLGYLGDISIVRQVAVTSARGGSAVFSLVLSASPQYLEEALAGSRHFEPDEESDSYLLLP